MKTFARLDAFCHRHVLCIAAVGVLFSAVCYSQGKAVSLDCSRGSIKVSATYRPQDSSHAAIRLQCSGTRAVVVRDSLFYSGMQN